MLRVLKKFSAILLLIPLLLSAGPVHAANGTAGSVDVRFKVGQESITMNGSASTIEKPYVVNGTTMIPLSIMTNALGATLQWDNQTQAIGLSYGTKTITLKIGDKNAVLNGKPLVLPVAPELKNGKTMVPLTLVTQFLGGSVTTDKQTGEIVIVGTSAQAANQPASSLDSDQGKTKIGDSYFGWTMKYPTGLVKDYHTCRKTPCFSYGDIRQFALHPL